MASCGPVECRTASGHRWRASGSGGLGTVLSGCGSRRTIRLTDHRSSPASFDVSSDFQLYGCVHVENLLPDFYKRKSSPSFFESEPCKVKMVTVSVEFRRWKFSPTVSPTKSRFGDKKIPKVTSKYTKALSWNYQIVTRFHKKNGISKLATFS